MDALTIQRLPLQASVTYPDSFTAMVVTSEFGLPYQPRPYNRRVHLLAELPDLVEQYGMPNAPPDEDSARYEQRDMEKYIEVQLWSDAPVRAYLLREDRSDPTP